MEESTATKIVISPSKIQYLRITYLCKAEFSMMRKKMTMLIEDLFNYNFSAINEEGGFYMIESTPNTGISLTLNNVESH